VPTIVQVAVHASQFPESVQRALLASLRARRVNHKFLYDGVQQAQKWLAVYEAYSPARTDADCAETYARAFASAARPLAEQRVHVIGLGCGGGQKDAQLLKLLKQGGGRVSYSPCDVSLALALAAYQTATAVICAADCFPLVCDLMEADDLSAVFERQFPSEARRLITFFGMLPNFEPQTIMSRLAGLLRPDDCLLLSANLAPGSDYAAGIERIVMQYDNQQTRDWLMNFLLDLGIESTDGELRFLVEDCPQETGMKRIAARFHFYRSRQIRVAYERFEFRVGEELRLFFSYRHTSDRVCALLGRHGIAVIDQWITRSEEEGIFLCRRDDSTAS
jgi:uncharacterized SAM-dependent methyltransferase